ncbi:MAG: O-antigen ligase family protein [bacterium]|nr:O-antigen ligase family protein [bacterium]
MAQAVGKKFNKVGGLIEIVLIGVGALALFSALFFSAQAGIFILGGAWAVALSWKYPKQAFWILLFFVPLLPLLKITQTLSAVTPLKDFIIAALFVRVVIYPIYLKRDPYRRNNVLLPIIFLVCYAVLAVLRADSHVLGILRLRDILLYIPMLWIGRAMIVTRKDFTDFLKIIFGSVGLVLVLALAQFIFFTDGMVLRFDPSDSSWITRASSVLAHPNILGSYLLCFLPLTFSFSLFKFKPGWKSKIVLLLSIFGLITVYATYSRGVWIAFIVGALSAGVLVVYQKRQLFYKVVLPIILVVLILFLAIPRTRNLLRTVVDPTYASNQARIGIMASLVSEMSNVDALLGRGLGDIFESTDRNINISISDIVANNVQSVQTAKAQTFVDDAVFKTWIETGLFGLLIVGWLVWNIVTNSWRLNVGGKSVEEKYFGIALFATTVGLFVLSFFLDIPETFPVALYWWTLVGVGQAVPCLKNDE